MHAMLATRKLKRLVKWAEVESNSLISASTISAQHCFRRFQTLVCSSSQFLPENCSTQSFLTHIRTTELNLSLPLRMRWATDAMCSASMRLLPRRRAMWCHHARPSANQRQPRHMNLAGDWLEAVFENKQQIFSAWVSLTPGFSQSFHSRLWLRH
jgi:hypothetical protein